MRQDFFEFTPQCKVVVITNHTPALSDVGESIRRRLHLWQFNVTIPAAERDPDLPEKLRREWSAILRWAVDGALIWQRDRLKPPACMVDATDEYLASEDTFALWFVESCEPDLVARTRFSSLFASWRSWCERNNQYSGTSTSFGKDLKAKGYQQTTVQGDRAYVGLRLKFG